LIASILPSWEPRNLVDFSASGWYCWTGMPTPSNATPGRADEYVVRHRNPLARDYVIVSRAVLVGYPRLSDAAKLTYWVVYSHDWYESDRGARKGFAYPSVARLAVLRHTTERTIQRHLSELIGAGLLTRVVRPGKPSLLYIEEPGGEEVERYCRDTGPRGDIGVGGGATEMSPHKKQEQNQTNHVNGDKKYPVEEKRRRPGQPEPIGKLLRYRTTSREGPSKRDWLAGEIVQQTGDGGSLGCYRVIAQRCPDDLVFEALSLLKEARRDGSIRQSRGALFVGIVRRLCHERGLSDPLGRGVGGLKARAPG
jgi:hypothetical protein